MITPGSANPLLFHAVDGSYQISRSLRFRSSASAYLSRTFGTPTNQKKWTLSAWAKLSPATGAPAIFGVSPSATNYTLLGFSSNVMHLDYYNGSQIFNVNSNGVFRDYSAWYHLIYVFDSDNATSTDRVIFYVNGARQSVTFSTAVSSGATCHINTSGQSLNIGSLGPSYTTKYYLDGYLAEVNFIDGQALTPSSFGAFDTNGVWQPIACTVSDYGKNGFYLPFSDSANIFNDKAAIATNHSAANNWTNNNLQVATSTATTYDYMIDSPTNYADGGNGRGNYCVMSPLDASCTAPNSGNLSISHPQNDNGTFSTFSMTSGRWWAECTVTAGTYLLIGICNAQGVFSPSSNAYTNSYLYAGVSGNKAVLGTSTAYGATYTANDVIGIDLNIDGGTITFYKQTAGSGSFVSQGAISLTANASGFKFYSVNAASNQGTVSVAWNFGQRPFNNSSIPTGASALNTQNLPTPTIAAGNKYFDVNTYTGDGTNGRVISGLNLTPDLFWTKARSAAYSHAISDTVRGVGFALHSDTTAAEDSSYGLAGAGTNSYTINGVNQLNASSTTYVAWLWKGGNGTSNIAVNAYGSTPSIASTVSANTSAGFSVVTYTGTGVNATVGHGLGAAPSMIIVKGRSVATDWAVYHSSISPTYYLQLDTTAAQVSNTTYPQFGTTAPTSSVFNLGTASGTNNSGSTYVAYCFAPVQSFSNAFSFTGNGSTDGVFIYLGFLPRMILLKRTDTTGNWYLWDTARNTYNAFGNELYPNLSNAEASATDLDVLSNGFKLRNSTAGFNASGGTYIGFAWASNPFKYSRGF